ncbi:MAG: alpha/beta hydrolase [Peptostreptococcaceae bacterium]
MAINKVKHSAFSYEDNKSNTIVIFIHGILESPNQFKAFAKEVKDLGYSYSAVLLDGHGSSGKDFANSDLNKWTNSVDKEILKHNEKYENIILVGHSMGALLSILSLAKYKDKVKGTVLISTPLKVFIRTNIMVSSIKIALGVVKEEDTLTMHAYNAFSVDRCPLFTYLSWIPRYKDLFSLIKSTRKELENIHTPALIIHANKDELVSNRSIKVFKNRLKNNYEVISLEKSGHFYYDEIELINILKEFRLFISKLV